MLLCCIFGGFYNNYPSVAIVHGKSDGKFQRGSLGENICFHKSDFSSVGSQLWWVSGCHFWNGPGADWIGPGPIRGRFNRPRGRFRNRAPRSLRESSETSSMLSGEVLGLGIPLLFGIHRKIVYCSVLDHLLAITIFEKTDRKSKISEHEIHHRKHFFTMSAQLRACSRYPQLIQMLSKRRAITSFFRNLRFGRRKLMVFKRPRTGPETGPGRFAESTTNWHPETKNTLVMVWNRIYDYWYAQQWPRRRRDHRTIICFVRIAEISILSLGWYGLGNHCICVSRDDLCDDTTVTTAGRVHHFPCH